MVVMVDVRVVIVKRRMKMFRARIYDGNNKVYLSNGLGTHVDVNYFIDPFTGDVIAEYRHEKGERKEILNNCEIELKTNLVINGNEVFENDIIEKNGKKYIIKTKFIIEEIEDIVMDAKIVGNSKGLFDDCNS
jgi:hypothetical protein